MPDSSLSRRAVMGGAAGAAGAAALGVPALAPGLGTPAAARTAGTALALNDTALALNDTMTTDAAWAAFLGTCDLVWTHVPTSFYQGAFLGNGGLGAAVDQTGTAKRITWRLGDTRPPDHPATGRTLFAHTRLPVGDLKLKTTADV